MGQGENYSILNDDYNVRPARVFSVEDPTDGFRIKVKLHPFDDNKPDNEIPYCFPLNPKFLHVYPKVGETVLVFLSMKGSFSDIRYFMGPVIPQDYFMDYAIDAPNISRTLLNQSNENNYALKRPSSDTANNGTIPDRNDIAIRGRVNSDIILKENEIRLRTGFRLDPNNGDIQKRLEYNTKDQGYIQIRYKNGHDYDWKDYNSLINVVADRINLITYDSRDGFSPVNMTDPKDLITDEELDKIFEKAHSLPYGDLLVEFLKKFVDAFASHTHPWHMMPLRPDPNCKQLFEERGKLDKILSKTIKIS